MSACFLASGPGAWWARFYMTSILGLFLPCFFHLGNFVFVSPPFQKGSFCYPSQVGGKLDYPSASSCLRLRKRVWVFRGVSILLIFPFSSRTILAVVFLHQSPPHDRLRCFVLFPPSPGTSPNKKSAHGEKLVRLSAGGRALFP